MKNPDINLQVEIREEAAYLSYETIRGAGGLPVGTSGKGMLMLDVYKRQLYWFEI